MPKNAKDIIHALVCEITRTDTEDEDRPSGITESWKYGYCEHGELVFKELIRSFIKN